MFLGINLSNWLLIGQCISLIGSIVLILLQQRGAGIGGTFGSVGEVYLTKRGIEKWVVNLTVLLITIFVILRFVSLYVG
jgi:protein translocase SecG subunit